MKTVPHFKRKRKGAGLTLIEVVIATSLLGIVFAAVAYIQSATIKQTRGLYSDARTLHRASLVLDRIRYKICMAQLGTVVVSNDGRTVEYVNPNLYGPVSMIRISDGKVYYYEDKTAAASTPGQGIGPIEDIRFELLGAGNAVRIQATTQQNFSWRLARPYTLNAEVTLRN